MNGPMLLKVTPFTTVVKVCPDIPEKCSIKLMKAYFQGHTPKLPLLPGGNFLVRSAVSGVYATFFIRKA